MNTNVPRAKGRWVDKASVITDLGQNTAPRGSGVQGARPRAPCQTLPGGGGGARRGPGTRGAHPPSGLYDARGMSSVSGEWPRSSGGTPRRNEAARARTPPGCAACNLYNAGTPGDTTRGTSGVLQEPPHADEPDGDGGGGWPHPRQRRRAVLRQGAPHTEALEDYWIPLVIHDIPRL